MSKSDEDLNELGRLRLETSNQKKQIDALFKALYAVNARCASLEQARKAEDMPKFWPPPPKPPWGDIIPLAEDEWPDNACEDMA